jgi:hypothetical protein
MRQHSDFVPDYRACRKASALGSSLCSSQIGSITLLKKVSK